MRSILFKSLVKLYYRQNAGLFAFLVLLMVLAVGRANQAGLLEYHYSLIQGLLLSPPFMAFVLLLWFLYACKCALFMALTLQKREFSFLYALAQAGTPKIYRLMLGVQFLLFLPVLAYVAIIAGVGYHKHWYQPTTAVLLYNVLACTISARWYLHLLRNPGPARYGQWWKVFVLRRRQSYSSFLVSYVLTTRKLLFLMIKTYSCGILYLMVVNRSPEEYDLRMIILFYSFGLLGHGVLIHRMKEMEETRLTFYRGLPASLPKRLAGYGWFYFLLLVPEIVTIGSLTPGSLRYADAVLFVALGYSVLLLLNSLLLFKFFSRVDYLKIIFGIFFTIFICTLTGALPWLSVTLFVLSTCIFFRLYYRFER